MEYLKGFCTFNDIILNGQKEVSTIGELSPYSQTFTRNLQQFSANPNTYSDIALQVLSYRDSNNDIITTAVKDAIIAELLPILDWVNKNSRNGVITTDYVQFNKAITAQFGSSTLSVAATAMFQDTLTAGTLVVPKFLTITNTDPSLNYQLKVWFVDSFFQIEYDEFELVVIPPIPDINVLGQSHNIVKPLIDGVSISDYNQAIFQAQDGLPASMIVTKPITWHQLDNNVTMIPDTNWTTLVYGPKGNNVEILNDNLIKHIVANSRYTEAQWQVIYPDLFIKDEFTIVPLWDKVAIGKHLTLAEIFSPQLRFKDMEKPLLHYFPNYNDAHVLENLVFTPTLWQSIIYTSCGGTRNTVKSKVLLDEYPDLILAQAGSVDYDRMNAATKRFIGNLNQLLVHANEYVDDGSYHLPSGMGTILRSGLTYISMTFDHMTLLVLARISYTH